MAKRNNPNPNPNPNPNWSPPCPMAKRMPGMASCLVLMKVRIEWYQDSSQNTQSKPNPNPNPDPNPNPAFEGDDFKVHVASIYF